MFRGTGFQCGKMRSSGGDSGCTATWMYLRPPTWTLTHGSMVNLCYVHFNTIKKEVIGKYIKMLPMNMFE